MRIGTRHSKNADSILQLSRVPGRTGKMYRAGIDLGGTNIKAGIIDENHKILAQTSAPIGVERRGGSDSGYGGAGETAYGYAWNG